MSFSGVKLYIKTTFVFLGFSILFSIVTSGTHAQDNSCVFRPVTYVIEKKADGKYYPLRSPDASNWGVIYDKVASSYGTSPESYSAFNRMGEFDPCGEDGCQVTTDTWGLEGLDEPDAQYSIKDGDVASVSLTYDKSSYKIIGQCLPNQKCQPLTAGSVPSTISNIPVKCGAQHTSGWVVQKTSITDDDKEPDPTENPEATTSPDPTGETEPTNDPEITGGPNPTKDPTKEVVTISGKITVVHPIGADLFDVGILCQGTCDSKLFPIHKKLSLNKTMTTYDYDFRASVGDTYKLKPVAQYRLDGDDKEYEYLPDSYRTVTTKNTTENFYIYLLHATRTTKTPTKPPVAPTKKVTTPAPTLKPGGGTPKPTFGPPRKIPQNLVYTHFKVKNASDKAKIENIYAIICAGDTDESATDYFKFTNINVANTSKCYRSREKATSHPIGRTTSALSGQTKNIPDIYVKSGPDQPVGYDGFDLTPGTKVMLGCRFNVGGFGIGGTVSYSKVCPLKEAIVGTDYEVIQNITVTANGDINAFSSTSPDCEKDENGNCKAQLQL